MIALQISSVRHFMSQLLAGNVFDLFLLEEAVIKTANTFTIDGHINREFYQESAPEDASAPPYDFRPWDEIKGLCFDLIKGKRTPLSFHFVLHLMPEQAESLLTKSGIDLRNSNMKALILTIRYDGTAVRLITGTSYHTFTLSKEADTVWDNALEEYLLRKGIDFEQQ